MKRKQGMYFAVVIVITGILFFMLGMGSSPERGKADEATPATTIVIKDEGGFSVAIKEVSLNQTLIEF